MTDSMTEVRCPTCNKLVAFAQDVVGDIRYFCRRCKSEFGVGGELPELACECGAWFHSGIIESGCLTVNCYRCHRTMNFTRNRRANGPRPDRPRITRPRLDVVHEIEERWRLLRYDRARRSVETAVGLRYDVFARDEFRCVYCGRGPNDGVTLEADHVVPRSKGGGDEMPNLITACWDCNRGKSDKSVDVVPAAG